MTHATEHDGEEAQEGVEFRPWHLTWDPGSAPLVRDEAGNPIATLHGTTEETLAARAALVASAPALLEALLGAWEMFQALATHATDERSRLAAQDMLPVVESALGAASLLGPITPEALAGP